VAKASDRFSIRKRVKVMYEDEAADVKAAERLFARLCVRMLLAEHKENPDGNDESRCREDGE